MPTWGDLWRQRQRWQRGALENIGMYGISSATARYWTQQFALGYGVIALAAYLALDRACPTSPSVCSSSSLFWVLVGALFAVERTVTVWPGGWRARLLAAPLLIELGYAIFLQLVYVKSTHRHRPRSLQALERRRRRGSTPHDRPRRVDPAEQPLVPAPRRLRRLQHPRLCRTRLRQAVASPAPLTRRLWSGRRVPLPSRLHSSLGEPTEGSSMAEDETLGSLFGKAKRWARQEIKNATKIGGDPRRPEGRRGAERTPRPRDRERREAHAGRGDHLGAHSAVDQGLPSHDRGEQGRARRQEPG